jgi:glycosyltransferase involved in cell wall biosynthesis|tara:strand:- start:7270 stop:8316 length:1047 start_codon:yes stop_codon:yes gene_type:complete
MKVAILPMEIASYISTTGRALRKSGITTFTINTATTDKRYQKENYNLTLQRNESVSFYGSLSKTLAQEFDVLNYAWGESIFSDFSDVLYAKSRGKKTIPSFLGSDVRRYKFAKNISPYFEYDNQPDDGRKERKLAFWSDINNRTAITGSEEMELLVSDFFDTCHNIGYGGMDEYLRMKTVFSQGEAITIVHAPSNPRIKGTEYVRQAIKKIKERLGEEKINYIELTDVSHKEALEIYSRADIILDQFKIGGLGYLAHEAMALGKPVVTYVSPKIIELLPEHPPILNTSPQEIHDNLSYLIKDKNLIYNLGEKSKKYIQKYHTHKSFTNRVKHAFTQKTAVKTSDYSEQ